VTCGAEARRMRIFRWSAVGVVGSRRDLAVSGGDEDKRKACWPRAAATTEWRRASWAWQMTALAEYGLYDGLRLQIQASLALLSFEMN
jgi:hypothetical protein